MKKNVSRLWWLPGLLLCWSAALADCKSPEKLRDDDRVMCTARTLPMGAQSIGGNTASAQTDLSSIVRVLYQGGDLGDILAEQLAEVDVTLATDKFGAWKLQGGVETDAEIYPKLAMNLDGAGQSSLKDQLSKDIDQLDAFSLALVLVPENKENLKKRAARLTGAIRNGLALRETLSADPTMSLQTAARDDQTRKFVSSPLKGAAHRIAAASLANRNSLTFSAKRQFRSGVTGPDETTVVAGYEMGIANADGALRMLDRHGCTDEQTGLDSTSATCKLGLMAMTNFLQNSDERHRLKIAIEYKETDSFTFADESTMFEAAFANSRAFALTGSYSREVGTPIKEVNNASLAVEFSFEDVKDNEELNDRALLKATYTLDFGDWELPITLTWSNKSELVGDAGSKLGGHIGIQLRPDGNGKTGF